jgi:hypothetical protein
VGHAVSGGTGADDDYKLLGHGRQDVLFEAIGMYAVVLGEVAALIVLAAGRDTARGSSVLARWSERVTHQNRSPSNPVRLTTAVQELLSQRARAVRPAAHQPDDR